MSKRKKKVIIISRGAGNGLWSCRFLAFREIVFKKSGKTFEENTSINSILRYHVGSFSLFTQICLFQLSRQKAENINRYEEILEALSS